MTPAVPEQIEKEIVIDAPVERVWEVLTEARHFQRWFAFDGASIDPRPGGEIVMQWKEHGVFHARVEEIDPPWRFVFRGSRLPDERSVETESTLVTFTLEPEGAGTRLRVVESGFRDLPIPAAEQADFAAGNVKGWEGAFATLQAYMQELAVTPR